ncbi:hypothetical protein diail_570 [Diaporthe ilicicola]|nr:hypothetical protein diail_570 [Diaporthe ilicicola]
MSGTTKDTKSGVDGLKITNGQQQKPTGTKPSTNPTAKGLQRGHDSFAVPAAPTAQHAENYDEAPPGVPGPDYSSAARDALRQQAKPVFTRGRSMLDFTAITSAGPTPAATEMASYFDGSRRRESHLPDGDVDDSPSPSPKEARRRRQTVTEADSELPRRVHPGEEVAGTDAFAPRTSRQETEEGVRDATSGMVDRGE